MSNLNRNESREMNEPIRNELAGPVSWLIPAPPKRARSHQPPELRRSSSPKPAPTRSVAYPSHSMSSESHTAPRQPTMSPHRLRGSSNFSPPGSPNSTKTSTILRAWTKIFETAAHEMYTLCEADIEKGVSSLSPSSEARDKDSREQDRISAAIRRTKSAIYSVEFALLEFHALIRRSAVEARFEPQTTISEGTKGSTDTDNPNRNMSTNSSLESLDPKKQSCAWVVSTRAPLTQKQAFDTVSEVLESLQRYSQYTESNEPTQSDNTESIDSYVQPNSSHTSTIFSQSSPTRQPNKPSSRKSQVDIQPKLYKKPTPSSHIIAEHFREDKVKTKLRPSAKEYIPPVISTSTLSTNADKNKTVSTQNIVSTLGSDIDNQPTQLPEVAHHLDGDDLSSLGGGTEDLGTEDGEDDYVERVVLSARKAVWSEAEAWVDAAEKIALSLHDDNSDFEDENVLYGSDDALSCESESVDDASYFKRNPSADMTIEDGCHSIDEDSAPSTPLRASASSRLSPWDSPRSQSNAQRSPFNNLSHSRRKGDGVGNMKANHLLKLRSRHDQTGGAPLLRGAEAKVVSSSKDVLWRRNVADIEQFRAERVLKAQGRREAAYAKAKQNQEISKKKLDASAERAAAVVSREQKKTSAFAVNNNQKVSEVMFMKSLSAEGFQFGLQQRLKECEERILATTNRRQAYLQLRAEKASARNRAKQYPKLSNVESISNTEQSICSETSSDMKPVMWSESSLDELRTEAKRRGLQPRGTRKQLMLRIMRSPPIDGVSCSAKAEVSPDSDRNARKREMSARRLAHELDASKRWAVLEKRLEVLSSLGAAIEPPSQEDSHKKKSSFSKNQEFDLIHHEDQYYMSSSEDDEVETENNPENTKEEVDKEGQGVAIVSEEDEENERRKNRKQQRRRKMKEQSKQKVKVAKEEAANEAHCNQWLVSEEVKCLLMNLRNEFYEIIHLKEESDNSIEYSNIASVVQPTLKDMTVAVNDKINAFWKSMTDGMKPGDPQEVCGNFDETNIKQSNIIRKLLGDLMVLKGMSRSHWTSNDHLKRRSSDHLGENMEDDENNDAASILFSPQFFISPKRLSNSLDTMSVSPHLTSPSVVVSNRKDVGSLLSPTALIEEQTMSTPSSIGSPSPTPSPSFQSIDISSPLPSTQLFKGDAETSKHITYTKSMSPEGNVIKALLRALHLVSNITTSPKAPLLSKEIRAWCSSMLSTTLSGISLWLEAYPKACSTFFTFSIDSLSLITLVDMLNSELVQWLIAYRTGKRKPPSLLLSLLSIVQKAVQFEPSQCSITAQQVFWHYLCRSRFLVASATILEWRMNPGLVKPLTESELNSKAIESSIDDHIIQILKCIGYLSHCIGADAFKSKYLNCAAPKSNDHINKIMELLLLVESNMKEAKLVGVVRQYVASTLEKQKQRASNSSNLSHAMFPDEQSIILATNSLLCLNRMHRLVSVRREGVSDDDPAFSIPPSLFHDLWCLARLIITGLGGGEVNTSTLSDQRQFIDGLLGETIELVGFLTSHRPPNKHRKKKGAGNTISLSQAEESSLLRELLLLPFSFFITHRYSLYPSLLAIASASSKEMSQCADPSCAVSGTSFASRALHSLRGKLASKHLSDFLKEVINSTDLFVLRTGGCDDLNEFNVHFDLILNNELEREYQPTSTRLSLNPTHSDQTQVSSTAAAAKDIPGVSRESVCNAMVVCAVTKLEWSSCEDVLCVLK